MAARKILEISTAHLSDETNSFLAATDCMDWPTVGGPYRDLGWIFHVDEDAAYDSERTAFQDLFAVFRYAMEHDFDLVLFDDITEPTEGLKLYRDPETEAGNPLLHNGSANRQLVHHRNSARSADHKLCPIRTATHALTEMTASMSMLHHGLLDSVPAMVKRSDRKASAKWIEAAQGMRRQAMGLSTLLVDIDGLLSDDSHTT